LTNSQENLHYPHGVSDMVLYYHGRQLKLRGYLDTDWGGNQDESSLASGYFSTLSEGSTSWCSKEQECVALSIMEVEYVAYCLITYETIWLRSFFFQDLNLTPGVDDPIKMLCNNTAAVHYVKDSKFHRKTKRIKRHHYFVREAIKRKDVSIKYISTNKMALGTFLFQMFKCMILHFEILLDLVAQVIALRIK